MRFTKMHGIGNDYVYLDAFVDAGIEAWTERPGWRAWVRAVSDRHRGIGSDGVILVCRPRSGEDHARMRMYNADGSESAMCGNGVRCVAKFAHDRHGVRARPMRVETGRGVLAIDYTAGRDPRSGADVLTSATVDMGAPILEPIRIPTTLGAERAVDVPLRRIGGVEQHLGAAWAGRAVLRGTVTCVSMGNPHAVIFCGDDSAVPLEILGPAIEHAPEFPERINVHVARMISAGEVSVRTWERGAGITQACGTGACAVVVAASLLGLAPHGVDIEVHLPGGDLRVRWSGLDSGPISGVLMTGTAEWVYDGEWPTLPE